MLIDSLITLHAGAEHVEVETTVNNMVRDHRLRVMFPTGIQADTYWADSPFDVIERPIALRQNNHLYRELEVETKPQQTWTAVFDDNGGLAVISAGLCESAVQDLPERPIALTLVRATRRTVFTDGEPNGQIQGRHTFRYWLAPLTGAPEWAHLCRLDSTLTVGCVPSVWMLRISTSMQSYTKQPYGEPQAPICAFQPKAGFCCRRPAVVTSLRQAPARVETFGCLIRTLWQAIVWYD